VADGLPLAASVQEVQDTTAKPRQVSTEN